LTAELLFPSISEIPSSYVTWFAKRRRRHCKTAARVLALSRTHMEFWRLHPIKSGNTGCGNLDYLFPRISWCPQNCCMRSWVIAIILVCSAWASSFAHVHRISRRATDPPYAAALAAANRFLHAWQTEDHETGIVMLTDSAREHATPEQLQDFFSPGSQAAYEISRGKRVSAGTYEFPVVLFGSPLASIRPRVAKVILRRDGKNDWAVDRLP